MALPMNATPVYTLQIPTTKKEFKYRPFLVKDEKALLIAQQSEDVAVMLDTVKEVIKSCAKNPIDIESLASVDIEYMFLQMRAKSIGEMVELIFACDIDHGEDNPKAQTKVQINLEDVKVEFFEGHNNKIELFGDVGVVLKYPNVETLKKIETAMGNDMDQVFDIVVDCIDFVYDAEQAYPAKEQKREELLDFLNNLTSQQFEKVQAFFRTMPQLRAYVNYKCPVCGRDHNKYLEGLASFF